MTTSLDQLTPEQKTAVLALMKEFATRLLPAKLVDNNRNGLLLADWVNTHRGGVQSVDNLYDAANALCRSLDWDRKPKRLLLEEQNERPATIQSANAALKPFLDATKAGEVKAAKEKADEENRRKARAAVSAFLPVDKRGHVLYSKRGEVQKLLGEYLDREFARPNINTADVLAKVTAYITDQYAANERASERV